MPRPTTPPTRSPLGRRNLVIAVALLAGAGVLALVAGYAFFFGSTAPDRPDIGTAVGALRSPTPAATIAATLAPADPTAADPTAEPGTSTLDGTWVVDTARGSFADFTGSWAGYRIKEVLRQIGDTEAAGRTPEVRGEMVLSGTQLASGSVTVDTASLRTDQSMRDGRVRETLRVSQHPTAVFEITAPVDLGAIPAEGESVTVTVPGELTAVGTTIPVEAELTAQVAGDVIVVVGSIPVTFTDFGISMPEAMSVLSVEESGLIEFQLYFMRA